MNKSFFSWRALTILGTAALVLGIAYQFKVLRRSPALPQENTEPPPEAAVATEQPISVAEPQEVSPSQFAATSQLPVFVQPATRSAANATAIARSNVAPDIRELVASLGNLDPARGPITREQAEQWKQQLATLVQQGSAAVPAIREFLAQNQELNFGAINGGAFLGRPSLRAAFIGALQQIGGTEATDLMLQTLQTTTLPPEIGLLARNLEQQSPGLYRQEILSAAQEVLGMSEKGQLPDWDVGALFQVFQHYGDASTAATLEQLRSRWNYYATLSLAGMQNGEGISVLIHEAQSIAGDSGSTRSLALQMLAQVATQSSDAATALVEQARLNQIPESAWRRIASGLAGDQYGIGLPPGLNAATQTLPGLKTYHLAMGNQNFHSLPLPAAASAGEIQQRRTLIEQLLAVSSSPAAVQALTTAQATLAKAAAIAVAGP